ncbi:hypothetical protein F5880DRAFT_725247 [Lentinula raphanica]|nr:hypothetical protein F5880DRAFT_725247 [Lentinula raphanica]
MKCATQSWDLLRAYLLIAFAAGRYTYGTPGRYVVRLNRAQACRLVPHKRLCVLLDISYCEPPHFTNLYLRSVIPSHDNNDFCQYQ